MQTGIPGAEAGGGLDENPRTNQCKGGVGLEQDKGAAVSLHEDGATVEGSTGGAEGQRRFSWNPWEKQPKRAGNIHGAIREEEPSKRILCTVVGCESKSGISQAGVNLEMFKFEESGAKTVDAGKGMGSDKSSGLGLCSRLLRKGRNEAAELG